MMRCSVRQIEIVALLASAMVQCAFGHGTSLGTCAHVTRDEFAERDVAYKMMREAGMDCVRCDFDWRWYQNGRDAPFDWRKCDAVVGDAAKNGITVLPILCNPPDWARPVQNHVAEWRSFVRETTTHFKGRIPVYEIWNEENHPGFYAERNSCRPEEHCRRRSACWRRRRRRFAQGNRREHQRWRRRSRRSRLQDEHCHCGRNIRCCDRCGRCRRR